jgi:imidazolonepropionase-like amidohydrolase
MKLLVITMIVFLFSGCIMTVDAQKVRRTQAVGTIIVLTHINVVDTRNSKELKDRNVIITNGRIKAVENFTSAIDKNASVIDCTGKYLIPGLWDMEVHLSWCKKSSLALLVANGVTGVRDMGGDFAEIAAWKQQIEAGTLIGPHILQVGPMLNGKSFNRYQLAAGSPDEVKGIVRTLKFMGVDGIEIERRIPGDVYKALMEEAKRDSLPVGGHVQLAVSPEEASNSGQNTIENIESLYYGTFSKKISDHGLSAAVANFLISPAADTLFRLFVSNHTAVTPVLNTFISEVNEAGGQVPPDVNLRYVAASLLRRARQVKIDSADLAALRAEIPELIQTVTKMYQDSVTLLAGTDIAGARVPGFSLHQELEQFVAAGLSPASALKTATVNPASVLGLSTDFGSIEPGKIADLVILEADPLADIKNTAKIAGVILRGKYLSRKKLDILLQDAAREAQNE